MFIQLQVLILSTLLNILGFVIIYFRWSIDCFFLTKCSIFVFSSAHRLLCLLWEEVSAALDLALASWCPSSSSARSPPSRFPVKISSPTLPCSWNHFNPIHPGPGPSVRDQHDVDQLWHPRLLRLHLRLPRLLPRLLRLRALPGIPHPQPFSSGVSSLFGKQLTSQITVSWYFTT